MKRCKPVLGKNHLGVATTPAQEKAHVLLGLEPCPAVLKIDTARRLCLFWTYGLKDTDGSLAVTGAVWVC